MIQEWLDEYKPSTQEEAYSAIREIMQEIALAGLQRSGFFEKAAFYGGTALRIFYGLDRYSEDLDFSLLIRDKEFALEIYFDAIVSEFRALGMAVVISEKKKERKTSIDSAFLKSETVWKELVLESIIPQSGIKVLPSIKIKIEVDTLPPLGFSTEEKLLIRPFSFYVKCFTLPSLFAGKMHALLFRKWQKRVKGRDWYDLEWYIKKGVALDLNHFLVRAQDTEDWKEKNISREQVLELLRIKIENLDFKYVRDDVVRFIHDESKLAIWNSNYFLDLIEKMKFKDS